MKKTPSVCSFSFCVSFQGGGCGKKVHSSVNNQKWQHFDPRVRTYVYSYICLSFNEEVSPFFCIANKIRDWILQPRIMQSRHGWQHTPHVRLLVFHHFMCTKKARLASVWPMLAWLNTASSPQNATYVVGTLVAGWGDTVGWSSKYFTQFNWQTNIVERQFRRKTEGKTIDDRVRIRDLFRLTLVSEVSENVTSFTCISVCVYWGLI